MDLCLVVVSCQLPHSVFWADYLNNNVRHIFRLKYKDIARLKSLAFGCEQKAWVALRRGSGAGDVLDSGDQPAN
jgi:hypothetical protein